MFVYLIQPTISILSNTPIQISSLRSLTLFPTCLLKHKIHINAINAPRAHTLTQAHTLSCGVKGTQQPGGNELCVFAHVLQFSSCSSNEASMGLATASHHPACTCSTLCCCTYKWTLRTDSVLLITYILYTSEFDLYQHSLCFCIRWGPRFILKMAQINIFMLNVEEMIICNVKEVLWTLLSFFSFKAIVCFAFTAHNFTFLVQLTVLIS